MNLMNTWWFYIIIFLIITLIHNQSYKISTKNVKKDATLVVILEIIAGFTSFILISDRLNSTARRGLEVSTFNILRQISTVFVITWGLLFFKEPFIWKQILGGILIIFSNILILYEKGKIKFNKYMIFEIIGSLSISIANCIDIGISEKFNLPMYIGITLITSATLISITEKIGIKQIKEEIKIANKKILILTGTTWSLMVITQIRAYQLGNITKIAPFIALTVITNVIAGYIILKEKENILKKIIASIIIILGIILINIRIDKINNIYIK